ncbi:hypothetical protein [Umezawaea sp. NPDC059074]|uniref:hypothetical protein n=1 Tax=Umezawaea sp. NPDC059074 TaxID=3346716 RepID=UPI0036D0CA25
MREAFLRVRAVYQFYLDYTLPRSVEEGPPFSVTLNHEEFVAHISPRPIEEKLFPSDVDESLAGMEIELVPMDRPDGSFKRVVRDMCLDRIQVVLDADIELDQGDSFELLQKSLQRAVELVNFYLSHIRVVAKSPYVKPIGQFWRPDDGQFYTSVPHSIIWFNAEDNSKVSVFPGGNNAGSSSGSIRSPESGFVSSSAMIESMSVPGSPPLDLSLLVDAEESIISSNLREAVLCMSSAVEIAAKRYLSEYDGGDIAAARAIVRDRRNSFAKRYLQDLPEFLDGKSFLVEHGDSFSGVEDLYRERNSLMHEGKFSDEFTSR